MDSPTHDEELNFDYWRHTAALDLLPQHLEDFQRLVKLLRFAPGFQLLFVRINDLKYRDSLINKLQEMLDAEKRPVHKVDLSDEQKFPDFASLESWLETHAANPAVIHLLNASAWLQGQNLEALNLRRNALAEKLDATLLWWLPASAVERVARQAPDAWSWRGGVFDFIDSEPAHGLMPFQWVENTLPTGNLTLAQCSQRLAVLNRQLKEDKIPDDFRMNLLLEKTNLLRSIGKLDDAEHALRNDALPLAERMGDQFAVAVIRGRIADILTSRGELEESLRIRQQEELPVYEKFGDERSVSITRSKIADILYTQGEFDDALRINKEVLPVLEKLGDIRSATVAQGKIADILDARGEFDNALKIRENEELPVYENLGDMLSVAISRAKIANTLARRGEFEDALKILKEILPVFEKLGDVHNAAAIRVRIESILHSRNESTPD